MRKALRDFISVSTALGGPHFGDYYIGSSKGSTQNNYTNKNANVEYYVDEKGNIRRRKIKKVEGK